MKSTNQKYKISRRSSASSTGKDKECSTEDKADRLLQLKGKIEKDRELMRKSGKRFSKQLDTTPIPTVDIATHQKIQPSAFFKKQLKTVQAGSQSQPVKQQHSNTQQSKATINLNELIQQSSTKLQSSRLFNKELQQQKIRNQEMQQFLTKIDLQGYADRLVDMGYDQLEVLVEIKSEELNFLMMRAHQQKRLLAALEQYRQQNSLEKAAQPELLLTKSTFFKAKTSNNIKQKEQKLQKPVFRPKSAITEASTTPTNNSCVQNSSFFSNPSFFCKIGGGEWSMDSMIRKACSLCFKIYPSSDLIKENDCYYCQQCKLSQQDMMGLSLSNSMVRDYS